MGKGKERISRKISSNAFIYDDGFVLGVAYLLCLLRQNLHYKTLHWDTETAIYIENAKTYSKEMASNTANRSAKMKEDLNTQNLLLLKKLELMEQEFKFFHYGIISSNVLFTTSENEAPNIPTSPATNNNASQPA